MGAQLPVFASDITLFQARPDEITMLCQVLVNSAVADDKGVDVVGGVLMGSGRSLAYWFRPRRRRSGYQREKQDYPTQDEVMIP